MLTPRTPQGPSDPLHGQLIFFLPPPRLTLASPSLPLHSSGHFDFGPLPAAALCTACRDLKCRSAGWESGGDHRKRLVYRFLNVKCQLSVKPVPGTSFLGGRRGAESVVGESRVSFSSWPPWERTPRASRGRITVMASLGPRVSHRPLKALEELSWKRSLGVGHEMAFVKYLKERVTSIHVSWWSHGSGSGCQVHGRRRKDSLTSSTVLQRSLPRE